MEYLEERGEAVLRKLLPPHNRAIASLAEEEGISTATLYNWPKEARRKGRLLLDNSAEPATLSEAELAEYCRRRGLDAEQRQRWRASCEQTNDRTLESTDREGEAFKAGRKRGRGLERELRRKESAVAETAALLTLRKKTRAIWGA